MNISVIEMEKEEQYLNKIKKLALNRVEDLDKKVEMKKQDIFELKKYIWTECKSLSALEYGNLLNNTDIEVNRTNQQIIQTLKYKKMLDNPYFGRVDFKYKDESIKVYIGMHGLNDENNNYIFDWRTPIASLFYDYSIGEAEYEAPLGIIKGNIGLRRQYKIDKGEIKRVIENDINIDDEILQEVLSSNSTDKMKNIVTTIQKEQNLVIRNTVDKYLIVQGVAGSGKTSVALHRIAYLLYKEKDLNFNNVLIFSPNNVFSEYISNVLPELGEENVLNTTFNDLVKTYLDKTMNIETFSEFLERKYNNINTNLDKQYTKNQIDDFLNKFLNKCIFKKTITVNGINFNPFELNELLVIRYKKLSFIERFTKISEYICRKSNIPLSKNKVKIKKMLLEEINIDFNPTNVYKKFLDEYDNVKDLAKRIDYDDLVNIVYIYFELNGYPYNTNVKHIVIDEAQDYSKLQFLILKRIFPYAYFTILGDINQAINPFCEYKTLNDINEVFDNKCKYLELSKTYRSSAEIIEFSNNILNIKDVKSVRGKSGIPIIIRQGEDINQIIEDIKNMKTNNIKTIAIITKSDLDTRKMFEKISKKSTDISYIKNTITKDKVSILPAYMAKGLEFDGVIVYNDIGNQYTEEEKKLFYVVCTRSQHQLIIYNN